MERYINDRKEEKGKRLERVREQREGNLYKDVEQLWSIDLFKPILMLSEL